MSPDFAKAFHVLMKRDWIDRIEDPELWELISSAEVQDDLNVFKEEFKLYTYSTGTRFYLVPKAESDLFLKKFSDYPENSGIKKRERYLLNYLSIFILSIFFGGEGAEYQIREFITKEDLVAEFTRHCQMVEHTAESDNTMTDYSENFKSLAADWLQKPDGLPISYRINEKYGIINKIMIRFKDDKIFAPEDSDEKDCKIYPTRKLKDLMPFFLSRERIYEINKWIEERTNRKGQENASDFKNQNL